MENSATSLNYSKSDLSKEFEKIWIRNLDGIKACCIKWLSGNQDMIEEAISLIAEKSFDNYLSIKGNVKSPFSWLSKITHNTCMDLHRDINRKKSIVDQVERLPNSFFFSENASKNLEESIADEDEFSRIIHRINVLPDNLRLITRLKFFDDLDNSEISMQLNISNANVRKRIQIARRQLRLNA